MSATMFGATSMKVAEQPTQRRRDNLALIYQNLLTVVVRLRANRQPINDAAAFRTQMQNALRSAEREAIAKLYPPDDVRLATFAVVAFLDESILNSTNPAFSDWARMPLQEEMFGHHRAGEVFFENADKLLTRADSHGVCDLLEVYLLCILLGYKGRYGLSDQDSVRPVADAITEKVRRVRGPQPGLSPAWAIPEGAMRATQTDPWIRRLGIAALTSAGLAVLIFFIFRLLLGGAASSVRALTIIFPW
jgi:type VI secretion system protein ImpK